MRRTRRHGAAGILATVCLAAAFAVPAGTANADPDDGGRPKAAPATNGDLRSDLGGDLYGGKKQGLDKKALTAAQRKVAARAQARMANGNHEVGDQLTWLALDDTKANQIYVKSYTLRGLGDHIQVWVADDRAFPDGDCRNALGLTEVTDEQVDNFVTEFDGNIYPKESAAFSVAPDRDGSDSVLGDILGDPDYYKVAADQADDTVVLVDNVRDDNYYAPATPDGQTYIAGFFYSVFNAYTNRNIMTIDAFDWLHRTGANPPDDSADPAYLACAKAQGVSTGRAYGLPRPRLYEGTFAHEYQHLLEYYEDPDEDSWINEGLSDYAQTLVGYVNTKLPPDYAAADGHIKCFAGYLGEAFGGPENSLTLWEDQGGPEILCDYGAAYTFMEYLASQYGTDALEDLHRENGNGFTGLQAVLDDQGSRYSIKNTVRNYLATMALDRVLEKGKTLHGAGRAPFSASELGMKVNWATPQAYESAGAPPNGADFVRLRYGGGYYKASQIDKIIFNGSETIPPEPVEWEAVADAPENADEGACGEVPTGAEVALYSGCGGNLDRSIVREVSVPAGGGDLTFEAMWDTEANQPAAPKDEREGWDFGVVQVSTDGGKTWESLSTEDTTSSADPGAVDNITAQLPGFTGESNGWRPQTADLSAYAGQDVLVGFRYLTDPSVNESGFWVRNIDAAGTELPSDSLDGWQTITQVSPIKATGYTVQIVAYDAKGEAWYKDLKVPASNFRTLRGTELRSAIGSKATLVAALVTYNDPTEGVIRYPRYALRVNTTLQPGG